MRVWFFYLFFSNLHPTQTQRANWTHVSSPSLAQQLSATRFLSRAYTHPHPSTLIMKAVGGSPKWVNQARSRRHMRTRVSRHLIKQRLLQTAKGRRMTSFLRANCRAPMCTQTRADTSFSQEDAATENEASGPLSSLWMTVLITWALLGPVCVCVWQRFNIFKNQKRNSRETCHHRMLCRGRLLVQICN